MFYHKNKPVYNMKNFNLCVLYIVIVCFTSVHNGIIDDKKSGPKGLYDPSDKIAILTHKNFNSKVLNKPNANFVEFYNSWCGHCMRFAPTWKTFGADVHQWSPVVVVGAIDCADDLNIGICREYEILQYPTLKFFSQKFKAGPEKIGELVNAGESAQNIRNVLVQILQKEQLEGRGAGWPTLTSQNIENLAHLWINQPLNIKVMFLIFETENSTMGAEVILDMNVVFGIGVKKVSNSSSLVKSLSISHFPCLVAVNRDLSTKVITNEDGSRLSFRKSIISHMKSDKLKGILELNDFDDDPDNPIVDKNNVGNHSKKELRNVDTVYLVDLEAAVRYTLTHEIPKLKYITGDALLALRRYLRVLADYFPFTANGIFFISELNNQVMNANVQWTGERFAKVVSDLESVYSPIFSTTLEYVGCIGSEPKYRGFTCGLWTMFHVITVNAAEKKTSDASEVLKAIYGFVKYFFGCSECSENFQALAAEQFKTVAEADGAIIWLWTAHNEVNHRLAGDPTEDPQHPKKQFPVADRCPICRDAMGAWDFKQVLLYLKNIYSVKQINLSIAKSVDADSTSFASLDSILFMFLYVYFAVMLIFILRLFLTKRIYKKKVYIHDTLGKV